MTYGNKEGNEKRIALDIASFLLDKKTPPVFMCIGSDKVVGDSLGVLVGEMLRHNPSLKNRVFGHLDTPITRLNLKESIRHIKSIYPNAPVIVIDAVLGDVEEVGNIKTYPKGIIAGGEFGKGEKVGDFSILGVVCTKGVNALTFLGCVRMGLISRLSKKIVESIFYSEKLCLRL